MNTVRYKDNYLKGSDSERAEQIMILVAMTNRKDYSRSRSQIRVAREGIWPVPESRSLTYSKKLMGATRKSWFSPESDRVRGFQVRAEQKYETG